MAENLAAMVQGFTGSGFAVSLLDEEGKTYTLMPHANRSVAKGTGMGTKMGTEVGTGMGMGMRTAQRCDSSAQATDGRYASIYKVQHCKVTPTSPPVQVTEFPPQRAELYPGHGNFEVGGLGSGETGYPPLRSNCYRGGMCWTDRGSVCSPRPSRDPDAFASSLRKYPPASPDRSSEIVERLITYSQAKNYARSYHRHHSPLSRYNDVSTHTTYLDRMSRSSRQVDYEPEVIRRHRSPEEFPTKERRSYDAESYRKQTFCKNNDVRFVRDLSKRLKETIKSMSCYPITQPACTGVSEQNDPPTSEMCFTNSVNMQIQAAAEMVSKRVETVPIPGPETRTVAIPLTPTSSDSKPLCEQSPTIDTFITKSVQTIDDVIIRKSVQTTTSSIELPVNEVKVATRKSKSFSEFRVDKDLKDEILEWLDDTSDPKLKVLQDAVLKKIGNKIKKNSGLNSKGFILKTSCSKCYVKENKAIKDQIANELQRIHLYCCTGCTHADVPKAESNPYRIKIEQNDFEDIIKDWVNHICIKKRDFLLRPVRKDQIYNTFVNRLKHLVVKKSEFKRDQSLRAEILDILDEIPIESHGCEKGTYLSTLADVLVSKLENISVQHEESKNMNNEISDDHFLFMHQNLQPTEKELKGLVADAMIDLINKTNTIIKPDCIEGIEMDLTDILMDSISSLRMRGNSSAKEEVASLLHSVIKLPVNEAIDFATQLTGHLKDKVNDKLDTIIKNQQETVLLLHNTSNNAINNHKTDLRSPVNNDQGTDGYFSHYIGQLSKEIDEWLANLNISLAHDKDFKQAVVHDLASDIIDRYKYLELNNSRSTDVDELEHLKYQIFKWVNKLVGEEIMKTINHASDLMERIRKHLDPFFGGFQDQVDKYNSEKCGAGSKNEGENSSKQNNNANASKDKMDCSICKRKESQVIQTPSNQNTQTVFACKTNNQSRGQNSGYRRNPTPGPSSQPSASDLRSGSIHEHPAYQSAGNTSKPLASSLRPPCCSGPHTPGTPSMKQLNDEFNDFLMNWVQEIPIPANTPEEQAMADKARTGIHHGIWKTIIKIKFHPEMFHNKFYYEDVLEEELDELLDCLPQSQELQDKRHLLKIKLIERTTEISDLIKTVASPATYKQQLAQQIAGNLPRTRIKPDAEDPKKQFEEMLIQCIAEDFILSTRYKEEDKVKAIAYRNKVIKKIESFLDEVKKTHGKEIEDLDKELCVNDIFSALHKVPLPSDETIREEADEILLGIEIDQWFTDLPVVKNDEQTEQLHRKRLKDALTKKLHEMEKELNVADCYGEPEFKHEISLFLDKVPLEKDEDLNINFMVDELTNRMKNRERAGSKRRSVAFQSQQIIDAGHSQRQSQQGRLDASGLGKYGQQSNMPWPASCNQPAIPPNQDDYHQFAMERQACSSMINPPPEPEAYPNAPLPDFNYYEPSQKWYSWDTMGNPKESSGMNVQQDPQLVYAPGRFHEENLGGDFGQTLHGGLRPSERYAYPGPADSPNVFRPGPSLPRFFDTQANVIPYNMSTPEIQNQPNMGIGLSMNNQMGGIRRMSAGAPQNFNSALGGSMYNDQANALPPQYPMPQSMHQVPPTYDIPMNVSSYGRFNEHRPPASTFNEPSGGFVSLLYDGNGPPGSYVPGVATQGAPNLQRSHFEPYMQPREQTLGGRFANNNTQAPQGSCHICSGQNSQRGRSPSKLGDLPNSSKIQVPGTPEEGLVKSQSGINQSRKRRPSMHASQERLQTPHHQDNADTSNVARSPRGGDPAPELHQSSGVELQQVDNRGANVSSQEAGHDQNLCPPSCRSVAQNAQNRSLPQTSSQGSGAQSNEVPSSNQDQRFLAPNPPPSGISISNQPGGFSTPNQRISNAFPPNVKVRRQMDRNSRRVETDTDDDDDEEVRVRCQCIERVRRCKKKRGGRLSCDCEDCLGAFPYYFPMSYPFPYMFNPLQPNNTRRHCQ